MDFKKIEDIAVQLDSLADMAACIALPIGENCNQPTPETLQNAVQGISNGIKQCAEQLYTLGDDNPCSKTN